MSLSTTKKNGLAILGAVVQDINADLEENIKMVFDGQLIKIQKGNKMIFGWGHADSEISGAYEKIYNKLTNF